MISGARLGPYEIVSLLGAGGMGEVHRAFDPRLRRSVAIKVLPEEVSSDPDRMKRFEREARSASCLNHPNIVTVYEVGRENGTAYLVMELVEGRTIRSLIADGPLPPRKLVSIAAQIADGLARAHAAGLVHRDLKPENLMVTDDGLAKILDFGLAKLAQGGPAATDATASPTVSAHTEAGVLLGTPAYMSPEQAAGQEIDFRSDQFALGSILWEMATGTRAFAGNTPMETVASILRDEPAPITKLEPRFPAPLGWLVQRCLSKAAAERYASTQDLARELQALRDHLPEVTGSGDAVEVGSAPHARAIPPRFPRAALLGAAAVALLAALAVGWTLGRGARRAPSPSWLNLAFSPNAAPYTYNILPLALSPDGRRLVYVGTSADRRPARSGGPLEAASSQLFVRDLDGAESKPLAGTEGAIDPFFSPDGRWVAFFARAKNKLEKVSLAGGAPVVICDVPNARGGTWGDDGSIVFAPNVWTGLSRVSADGGKPEVLTTLDPKKGELTHRWPEVLPGGKAVVFAVLTNAHGWEYGRIVVQSLRTGERRTLVEGGAFPRVTPSGYLVFVRGAALLAAPFSADRLELTGSPVPVLDGLESNNQGTGAAQFAFSRRGTFVYVPAATPERALVWVDRAGRMEPVPLPKRPYRRLVVSPDGERLATIIADEVRNAVWVHELSRETSSRLTLEGDAQGPVWSPDGKRIAYVGAAPGRPRSIFWQLADGSSPPELLLAAENGNVAPLSFSPDGTTLLILGVHAATGMDLSALSLGGERRLTPFLQSPFNENGARFSPDGRWVAYESDESGRKEIYVQAYPGPGAKRQVSSEGGDSPRWSPTGRELFFLHGRKLLSVALETTPEPRIGKPTELFEAPYGVPVDYDVAPDGKRFVMIQQNVEELTPRHFNVVLDWFEDLRRRVQAAR